ncbi:MAG TPA: S26 family signal peptidase, partial [Gillisia sp.]|nr:S26 family signal peptidase [Gillisia sp.]
HNSLDSRYFGFVPENHIVGKPVFIWMSWDANGNGFINKVRWDRLFTTVGGPGDPVSYLPYFLIVVVILVAFSFFKKRRES